MKRSKRLQVVLDLAERRRKQADQWLAEAQNRVAQGQQTLEKLEQYYLEYGNDFYASGAQGVSVSQLQTHQAFMQKLRQAIEQQQQANQMDEAQLERVKAHWQSVYGHFKAIDSLVEKAKTDEQVKEDKLQQKLLDERSQLIRPPYI